MLELIINELMSTWDQTTKQDILNLQIFKEIFSFLSTQSKKNLRKQLRKARFVVWLFDELVAYHETQLTQLF